MKYSAITLLAILFSFTACVGQMTGYDDIDVKTFKQGIEANKEAVILDVRKPSECEKGYIPNALEINWLESDFNENAEKLDKSKAIYVYCAAGGRSTQASKRLVSLGFTRVYNLQGGYNAWVANKYPTTKP